jgi:hypothetical protein
MDASAIIAILEAIARPIVQGGTLAWLKARQLHHRWQDRKPPLYKVDALRAARSSLGGSVVAAIPFRNLGSKKNFLALARRRSDEDLDVRVFVLEQAGSTYEVKWASESLGGNFHEDKLFVTDIDRDGCKEIAFELESFGSGAGSRSLYVYSIRRNILAEVTEECNYSDAATPDIYPIRIEAGDDEQFRNAVVAFAHSRGFLEGNEPVDYDLPKFAVLRWHKENGEKRTGRVRTYLYNGRPGYGASVNEELDTEDIVWVACFKGPLFGYIKSRDQHFIAYSPQWVYEWPKSLAFDGHLLWFNCYGVPGLFSYEPGASTLNHYCSYGDTALPESLEVRIQDGSLLLLVETPNDSWGFQIKDPAALMVCQTFCKLTEPHIPKNCYHERHREDLETLIARIKDIEK